MMNNKVPGTILRFVFLCSLLTAHCSFAYADFGVILDQTLGGSSNGDDSAFGYSGVLVPRFSTFWGGTELYASVGLRADYENGAINGGEGSFVPELLRTELTFGFGNMAFKAGRLQYQDPLGYIADGLFDGARFSFDGPALGSFGAGAFYTGLLYKKRANISMTVKETTTGAVDYADFVNTYFAPKRFIAALDWEHQSLFDLLITKAAFIGQFDLNGSGSDINSQYIMASLALPLQGFLFDLGGCLELIQGTGKSGTAFSGDLGVIYALPGTLEHRFAFLGRYTSGTSNGVDAFLPITSKGQGFVFRANHSGITMLSLDYAVRFHPACSVMLQSSYFIRNDLKTYEHFGKDGYALGNEFFGRLIWSPVSDMRFDIGAGVFLPSMGNVAPDAKALMRMEANMILSIY